MLKKPLILHEGYPFIAGALLIAVILAWAGHIYVAVIPFVLSCYFTFFFRCPDRNNRIPEGEDILVSPSDGTVMAVEKDVQEDYDLSVIVQCTCKPCAYGRPDSVSVLYIGAFSSSV